MRHVNLDNLKLPEGWEEKALKALKEIREMVTIAMSNGENPDISKAINARARKTWSDQELKGRLSELSKGKCWYCESKEIRSFMAVDHFRPKNAVKDTNHPGYWWLAFNWKNYRLSCTLCNSLLTGEDGIVGGKSTHFPLLDVSTRVNEYDENDPEAIIRETPVLLDPTKPGDVALLAFEADGRAVPRNPDPASTEYIRADVSIQIYHLNHEDIKEYRQALCNDVKILAADATTFYQSYSAIHDDVLREDALSKFDTKVVQLFSFVESDAEFSMTALHQIQRLATQYEWISAFLVEEAEEYEEI